MKKAKLKDDEEKNDFCLYNYFISTTKFNFIFMVINKSSVRFFFFFHILSILNIPK